MIPITSGEPVLPDSLYSARLGDLVELIELEALVLEVDGGVDERVEVVRVSLAENLGGVQAVCQVVVTSLSLVLLDAVQPRCLLAWVMHGLTTGRRLKLGEWEGVRGGRPGAEKGGEVNWSKPVTALEEL